MSRTLTLKLTQEEYAAIGAIAVKSAHLEDYVEKLLGAFANLDEDELRIFLGNAMIGMKLDMLEGLVRKKLHGEPKLVDEFKRIIAELKQYNASRKIAIHGIWANWRHPPGMYLISRAQWVVNFMDRSRVGARKRGKTGKDSELGLDAAKLLADQISKGHETLAQFVAENFPQITSRLTPDHGFGYHEVAKKKSR